MASLLPGLLLCLFLQCVPAFTELCKLENPMDGGNFSLSVSPAYYKPNTTYTVTISGNKYEVMVALSAYSGGNATGTWKNNAANCTGYSATRNLTFYEMWTSSSSPKHYVTFKAYVSIFSNMSYVMNKTIRAAPTTATPNVTKSSTMSMNTMTMTGTTVAASTMTATSTMSSTTPKGGAIAFKPLGGFASMLLLFVTVRELLL